LSGRECLSSAALIAADGVARGLGDHRREIALRLVERARRDGLSDEADTVEALVRSSDHASDRLYSAQSRMRSLIPGFVDNQRCVAVVGWLIVAAAVGSILLHTLGVTGGSDLSHGGVQVHLAGKGATSVVLLSSALLTLAMALPAVLALRRSKADWPLHWLRNAALLLTLLSALVHFSTEGFAALINLAFGLLAMAILSRHLELRERAAFPSARSHSD
jgi:hypothetical protein